MYNLATEGRPTTWEHNAINIWILILSIASLIISAVLLSTVAPLHLKNKEDTFTVFVLGSVIAFSSGYILLSLMMLTFALYEYVDAETRRAKFLIGVILQSIGLATFASVLMAFVIVANSTRLNTLYVCLYFIIGIPFMLLGSYFTYTFQYRPYNLFW